MYVQFKFVCSFITFFFPHTAEPYPPSNLDIKVDGLNLVAEWTEPFSLEGEQLSYVISITNRGTRMHEEVNATMSRYIFTKPISELDCTEYEFRVYSRNDYSKSTNAISGRKNIPTGKQSMHVPL